MFSRRDFLRGGAAAGLASAAPLGIATAGQLGRKAPAAFEAVCDTRWAEANDFLAALGDAPFRAHGIGADPGDVLRALDGAMQAGRPLVGMTTDAALVLAEHVAAREGYALVFHSEHYHDDTDHLTHLVRADAQVTALMGDALVRAGDQWPALLARHVGALGASRGCDGRFSTDVACARPTGSPGHLTAWALAPAST